MYETRTSRGQVLDWDIVVIGASSAGLYAATELAKAGKRVAVFEQAQTLYPARRTLIVTPHLRRILPDLKAPVLLHQIPHLILAGPNSETRVTLQDPDLIIERRALIQHLVEQAQGAGVSVILNRRFRDLSAEGNGARVCFQNAQGEPSSVTGAVVLGADGVFSDVALKVGLTHPPSVPILQAEIELPAGWDPAVTKVWFDTDDTRFFYWLIPESATRGVVGLVGDERAKMRPWLRHFLDREGFKPLAYQGARIAMYHPRLKPASQIGKAPVWLIGDAAGHVKVTTVGGTVSGLLGAQAAVRALVEGIPYMTTLREVQRELELHWWMRVALDRFGNAEYERLLRAVNPRVRDFLGAHNRDALAGVAWQLPFIQPEFAALAPRLLVRSLRGRLNKNALAPAQD